MVKPCAYHWFEIISGHDLDAEQCPNDAAFTAVLEHAENGVTLQIAVQVCAAHDALLFEDPDYLKSIRLRDEATT